MERSGKAVVLLVVAAVVLLLSVIVRVRWKRARERAEEVRRKAYWVAMEAQRLEAEAMREYQEAVWRESQGVDRREYYEEEVMVKGGEKVKGEEMREEEEEDGRPTIVYVMGACEVCGKETNSRCKRCKAVKYCSGKCQIFDWRNGHKEVCRPAIIDEDQSYEPNPNFNIKTARVEEIQTPKITELPLQTEPKEDETANIGGVEKEKKADKSIQNPSIFETTNKGKNRVLESNQSKENEFDETAKIRSGEKKLNEDNSVLNPSNFEMTNKGKKVVMESRRVSSSRVTLIEEKIETSGKNMEIKSSENVSESSKEVSAESEGKIRELPYKMFSLLFANDKLDKLSLRPFGLVNIGNSCYANVVFQCLMFTRPLMKYLSLHKCMLEEWCLACEFQKLVLMGKQGVQGLSLERILCKLIDKSTTFNLGKQEDAHEFMRFVIDKMQSVCMRDPGLIDTYQCTTEETTPIQMIFGGYLGSKIRCENCQGISERTERMLDLTVEIEGNIATLEEALAKFTSVEILDGDNKYHCSRCNSYERAKKKMTILEAPNVLTIALKRFQSGRYGKISKPIKYPSHLNLSPYLTTTEASPVYTLYAVVVHKEDVRDDASSGHYVAYVKDLNNKWYKLNDSKVKRVSAEKVLSKCAYMLLYTRCVARASKAVGKDRPKVASVPLSNRNLQMNSPNLGGAQTDGISSETSSLLSTSDEGSGSSSTTTDTSYTSSDSYCTEPSEEHLPLFGYGDRVSHEITFERRERRPGEPEVELPQIWGNFSLY